ncbi:MAG: MATE family efflux transporter [Treponema sp.]|nr:MATE family efflux transporter [Treponema sp.]
MIKNMTDGNPLKLIIHFSIPLLLGNLFQQTYNMIDAIIVGRYLGTDSLAAVGASSSVQFLILGFCIGMCCGFAIPIAQRFGANDFNGMREYIFLNGILVTVFAVVITIFCAIFTPQILHLLKTPEDIFQEAYNYLIILFIGIPFTLLYNTLAGILRSVGDSRTPFIFLVISASLNIILDIVFIMIVKWGCAGAAIATIVSQAISAILCILLIKYKFPILHLQAENKKWNSVKIKNLLNMGIPMGLQFSITAIGSMVLQASNNNLGSIYVSAFTAGTKIKQLTMCPFDALSTAVSTFASQNYGAGKIDRIKKGLNQGVAVGITYGIFIGLALIFFGRYLSMIFISGKEIAVLKAAQKYAFCMGFFYWLLGILNVLRMSTQGLGYSDRAVFSGIMEMIARCIVSFFFVPLFGYSAICFADQTAWLFAVCYITPTCIWCIRRIEKTLKK